MKRKPGYGDSQNMNEDWKFMFGSQFDKSGKLPKHKTDQIDTPSGISDLDSLNADSLSTVTDISLSSRDTPDMHHMSKKAAEMHISARRSTEDRRSASPNASRDSPARYQPKYASCQVNLRQLVYHKKAQHSDDQVTRDLLDNTVWESRPPPAGWKPKGLLVAHLHEHRGAVNRIQVKILVVVLYKFV